MSGSRREDITRLLDRARQGDRLATDALLPLVYDELRNLANRYLQSDNSGNTLQATALVHEAYLRLVGKDEAGWQSRAHFVGAAATAIRHVLIDHSRRRQRVKRGGGQRRVSLDEALAAVGGPDLDVLALDEALVRLAEIDAQKARIVELRFFGGLTVDETATVTGVSPRSVARDWRLARAWLRREIERGDSSND